MAYTLGIDLGTSSTAAATSEGGRTEVLDLGAQGGTMPSLVLLREDGETLVGDAAERRASADPSRLAREFKRRFGDPTPIVLGSTPFGADALVAKVWAAVVARATERMGASPQLVALTHPASYGPYKLELLQQAARQAGIERPVFLPEPEAAAIQYAALERVEDGSILAVYDFGGGTFDATILRKAGVGFTVLGEPEGLERLGGADFDDAVLAYVVEALQSNGVGLNAGDGATRVALARLREECRMAKEALSEDTEATIPVMLPGVHTQVRLTRSEFEGMIRPRIAETTAALERAVRGAGITMAQVDRVVLVGGTSRIPLIAETVGAATGRPVAIDVHPKQVVALGAARVAAMGISESTVPASMTLADATASTASTSKTEAGGAVLDPVVPGSTLVPVMPEPPRKPVATLARPATAARRGRPTPARPVVIGGAIALVVLLAVGAFALFGGGGGETARAAEIESIKVVNNKYQVEFSTSGFTPGQSGSAVAFYWDSAGAASGTLWTSTNAFSGFSPSGRPSSVARICIVVVEEDGTIVEGSGGCFSVTNLTAAETTSTTLVAAAGTTAIATATVWATPTTATVSAAATGTSATATATVSAAATTSARQARITGIRVTYDAYVVDYTTNYSTPTGGQHVHFFFNTVPPVQAGVPAAGPWVIYYGPSPFSQYTVAQKPAGATQMCILAANPDHSVEQGTGNCWNLP